MKKLLPLILIAATSLSISAAKLVNNKQYIMIPLTAGTNVDIKHFMTADNDNSVSLSSNFSDNAIWLWSYVGGTATSAGHYTLKNVATGKYLFEETDGIVSLSDSDIAITKADSPITDAAVTFSADGKSLAVSSNGTVTISDDTSAATSAFIMMDYVASQSAEEIETAAANAVAVAYGIPDAINQLRPLLEASYSGARLADRALNVLYYSQTPDDISTQLVEVRRTAVRMLESDLENGATWQQKATGKFISGIWYGQFTDNGNTKVEDREFYLYNSSSKLYLVNNNGVIETSPTAKTLWTVAYFYGAGLAILPAENSDNTSLLLYPDESDSLILGSDTDLALIYIGEINMFGEGINSVKPVGTYDNEGNCTAVNAIELTLMHGAVASTDGTLTLSFTSDDETSVIQTISASEAKNPVTKTVDYDYYDNTGTHQSGSCQVDVYTIPLDETYIDGGQYMVRAPLGAYTLNGALSREMAGYVNVAISNLWTPIVTPAAGPISALTQITISGPDGIYPNPTPSNMATVDINCDGETLEMFFRDDFAEGGKYDSYNPLDPTAPWFTIPVNYSEPGRYSLYIERSFFIDNSGYPCNAFSIVWDIDEAGIINISVDPQNEKKFNLLGQPASRGLIISKGKKHFVR